MHDFEAETRAVGPGTRHDVADGAEGPGESAVGPGGLSLIDLQRLAGNAGVVQLLEGEADDERSPVHDVVGRGGGSSLDEATRTAMESRLGADFADVRIHTDHQASRSAEAVGANAYTVGTDVVFRAGQFDPGSPTGQRTLAHELTHVLQQKSGPVDGTEAPGGIRVSDPGDPFERAADRQADAAIAGPVPAPATLSPAAAPTVQSETAEPEEDTPVQRQALEDEDEEAIAEPG